jgi:hypothetical protein
MRPNSPQKIILIGSTLAVAFFLLFPRWEQMYKTNQNYGRVYELRTELGRRPVFLPPASISENRDDAIIPVKDFGVVADWEDAGIWCLAIAAACVGLLLVFSSGRRGSAESEFGCLTIRRKIISAVMLSLLLPIPGANGKPFLWIIYAIIRGYLTDDLGERFVLPYLFFYWTLFLLVSSIAIFLLLSLFAQILKSRARQPQT